MALICLECIIIGTGLWVGRALLGVKVRLKTHFNPMELLVAAKEGNLVLVRSLLSDPSCDLLARDEEGNTALHIAASRGHHDVVLELASTYIASSDGVSPGINKEGKTAIHIACTNGSIKCVDLLARKFPTDLILKDSSGNTPLMAASVAEHNNIVLLLNNKYEANIGSEETMSPANNETREEKDEASPKTLNLPSSLLDAAKQGSLVLVKAILSDPSCDLLARDEEGNTALHIAASRGHHDVVLELASRYMTRPSEASAGVNNGGQTPLHLACSGGWIRCVDPLAIKFPNEINTSDSSGNTPIMAAVLAGHETITSLLKERYKVDNESEEGKPLTHAELKPKIVDLTVQASCLLTAAKRGSVIIVRALLSDPSCELLARDEEGNTALHIAASRGHHDVVLELASRYMARPSEASAGVNNGGQTPLHLACSGGWIICVDPLAIKFPNEINITDSSGNTPIMAAVLAGHETITSLLKERYKVDNESEGGKSLTHKELKTKNADLTVLASCLLTAAKRGSVIIVRALLSDPSCDLLARDEEGNTALHIAASRGHHDVVLELASRYTSPSDEATTAGVNNGGQTPLHLACSGGWIRCVDPLAIKFPNEINISDSSRNTPIMAASLAGHETITSLLKERYKVDIESKGGKSPTHKHVLKPKKVVLTVQTTHLLEAAKEGNLVLVRSLLSDPSCDLLARDEEGNTALHIAASRGHHDVVLELASRYTSPSDEATTAGVNNGGQTPLHLACSGGWIRCVDPLAIKFPNEINISDSSRNTPIMAASLAGHETITSLLKERYKVDIESKGGKSPTHKHVLKPKKVVLTVQTTHLLEAAKEGNLVLVRSLLSDPSCDLLARDEEGNTALHIAASRGHHDVVLELASRYMTPPSEASAGVNNEGETPLHLACSGGWIRCVDPLAIKFPNEINISDSSGNTPIMAASSAGHETITSLLKERYKVDNESEGGKSLTHKELKTKNADLTVLASCLLTAAKWGSVIIVRALLSDPSCDLMARDEEGNTALHIAASRGHHDVVLELVSRYTSSSDEATAGVNTPLHLACCKGWVECVRTLATRFPGDLKVKNEYDNLPLHDAASFGHEDIVDCLCEEFGGDVDSLGHYCNTCLFLACCGGHVQLTQKLLTKYECRRDALDRAGGLASTCAAFYGHTQLLQMLIDEFNFSSTSLRLCDGQSLLHQACAGKHYETANILINKYNLDPVAKDMAGCIALHFVCGPPGDSLENVGNFHTPPDVVVTTLVDHLISLKCDPMDRDKEGGTALHYAALGGQTEVVVWLVKRYKCPVECRDNDENTPLHKAAIRGHANVVQVLLSDLGADVEARNKQNDTALNVAALNGRSNVVTLLVDQFGCSPHTKGYNNRTPLHFACNGGHLELVEKLIDDYHCDPMARDDMGLTPLHIAALAEKEHVVRRLVSNYDCSVECRGDCEDTPLHYAAQQGHAHVVQVLLSDLGADVEARNKQNDTALNVAAENGHSNVVTLLVDQFGCSPHTKGYNNRTPLHDACWGGQLEMVEKLIDDYHCDPMARDDEGLTPLHIAAWAGKEHVVRRLVSNYNCSVEYRDNDGNTPLHCAAIRGHAHVVQVLLSDLGADVEARNKQNVTALIVAALNGHSNVVTLLVDQFGCSPHTKGFNNRTPLHDACAGGHVELVEKLIDDYHCDPMARDDGGCTPLHIAALAGKKSTVTTLILKYNCSPHVSDNDGDTLLHCSVRGGNREIVEILVDVFGTFSSIKNNRGKVPIDYESIVLFLRPNIRSCVEFLSKHAVGEYRHAPPKLLVLDEGVTPALNKYSTYSLLSSPFAQSCGLCYVDSVGSDVWVCQVEPDAKHNLVLQSLVSGPILMAVIAVSMNIPAGEAVSKVLSQVSLAKQLASQYVSKTPLKILFTGTSTLNKQNLFNGICKDIVENQPDDFIHFFQHFFICEHDKYQEKMFPIVSKFINKSVSTIRNPDVPEITHGSIFLLKFLYRENRGKFYITFSELSKQLQNERIMTEDHPEEIHACLRQLDEKGYLIITGTSDDPQCIILNPLHMLQTMDEFSHNVSEPLAHVGLYSQKLLSSLCFECEFSFIESFLSKFNLSLLVREPLVNLVKKEHIDKHVGDHFFFIPQLATCHRQVKDWTCQPEKVFSCGLSVIAIGKESYFSSHFQTTILLEAMKFFSNSFVMEPYPPLDCRVWKGGIQWMVENIEVLLEVVSDGNRVVLMGRSDIRNQLRCMDMFVKVVDMVLDVKSMCCGGIVHKIEVMDPFALESRTIPSSNELLWCDASSVIRALRIGKKDVRSTCKTKEFSVEKLDWLQRFSLQGDFPFVQ